MEELEKTNKLQDELIVALRDRVAALEVQIVLYKELVDALKEQHDKLAMHLQV